MSMNFALGLAPDTTVPSAADTLSFGEAASSMSGQPAAAQHGPHTLLIDPTMQMLEYSLPGIPDALLVTIAGVADTYVVQTFGNPGRLRVFSEGAVIEEQGDPLPTESILSMGADPEDAHLDFFCQAAGITPEALFALRWSPLTAQG